MTPRGYAESINRLRDAKREKAKREEEAQARFRTDRCVKNSAAQPFKFKTEERQRARQVQKFFLSLFFVPPKILVNNEKNLLDLFICLLFICLFAYYLLVCSLVHFGPLCSPAASFLVQKIIVKYVFFQLILFPPLAFPSCRRPCCL